MSACFKLGIKSFLSLKNSMSLLMTGQKTDLAIEVAPLL
jgi:hypothetical protein